MEQSNHLARQKPPNEYTKASGIEHKRIAGILVKKNEAVVKKIIKDAMVSVSSSDHHMFSIPLEVSVNSGNNWGEAH